MTIRPALLATLAALVLAGCASAPTKSDVQPPAPVSTAQAGEMLRTAVADVPQQFGMDMTIKNGSREMMTMKGFFDNASASSYMELTVAPDLFAGNPEAAMASGFFSSGFAMYAAKDAVVVILNGTAFAFPGDANATKGMAGGSANPLGAFRDLGNPSNLFANITSDGNKSGDATLIKSVTPVVYRGHQALEIVASTAKGGRTYDAKAIVFTDPTLLAHVEGTFPPESQDGKGDPFSAGAAVMDFFYGAEVTTKVPEKITRAAGLAYSSGSDPFGGSGSRDSGSKATWTFLHSGGVKLADATVEIKDDSKSGSSMGGFAPPDVASMPTLWSMKLADLTKSKDGVALTFDDHDHDAAVSAGDTLTLAWPPNGTKPSVALKDDVTGLYVVPGAPLVVGLGLAALAAIALRRR